MATISSSDLSIKSIKTQPEKKLISSRRLFSREISMSNTSCSEYYADASVAVPFMWESQPGIPKVKHCSTSLPPLTPPPSYYPFSTAKKNLKRGTKSSTLLNIVLPKLSFRKGHHHPQSTPASPLRWSPSSSSPSRTSFSVPSSPYYPKSRGQRGFSSPASSSFESSRVEDDEGGGFGGSPVSTLCFVIGGRRSSASRSCGFSPNHLKIMRRGELA